MKKNFIIISFLCLLFLPNLSSSQQLERIWSKGVNYGLRRFVFSPDGNHIATGADDMSVKIWNAKTGDFEYKLYQENGYIWNIDWSSDNKYIAFGGLSHHLNVYSLTNETNYQKGFSFALNAIRFSKSGKLLAYKTDNAAYQIMNTDDSSTIDTGTGFLSISSDEKIIACMFPYTNDSVYLVLKNLKNSDTLAIFIKAYPPRTSFEFYSDYFVIFDYDTISYYSIPDFHLIKSRPILQNIVQISKDGNYAIILDSTNSLSIWDFVNYKKLYSAHCLLPSLVHGNIVISPDNKYFAIARQDLDVLLDCYDLITGNKLWSTKNDFDASQCVSISPDNKYILSSNGGTGLDLLSREDGDTINILCRNPSSWATTYSSDFSNDSAHFAFNYVALLQLFDINFLNKRDTIVLGGKFIICLRYSPDGKYLAVGLSIYNSHTYSYDYYIDLFNINSKLKVWECKLNDRPTTLSFSKDGRLLAIGTYTWWVNIIDASNGTLYRNFRNWENGNVVNYVALSPDGKYVVAANYLGNLRSWDVEKNELYLSYNAPGNNTAVAITKDGNTIISGGFDGKIKFWDLHTGKLLYTTKKKETGLYINDLKLSNDEKYLVIGDAYNDGIMLFSLDMSVGVKEAENNTDKVVISPNPASDYINISDIDNENSFVEIWSVLGQKVFSSSSTGRIDISFLQTGLYFLKINSKMYKFVKI
jgi:WD40 repeat protein